jgi:hypothetical protein
VIIEFFVGDFSLDVNAKAIAGKRKNCKEVGTTEKPKKFETRRPEYPAKRAEEKTFPDVFIKTKIEKAISTKYESKPRVPVLAA